MKKIPALHKIRDDKRLFYSPGEVEKPVYQKINEEIKNKYNITLNSRDTIIKNIINILTQGDHVNYKMLNLSISVIRTDISNFYPSIDKHSLYKKISRSNILTNNTLQILKPLFFSSSIKGIPLGLSFSSSLSEIYLEDFDTDILINFNPVFYFRYVDDIIIVLNGEHQSTKDKNIFKNISIDKLDYLFNTYSLTRNDEKTKFAYHTKKDIDFAFEYLGYHFKSKDNRLCIDISDTKTKKIIKQIKHNFNIFKYGNQSTTNFWKLYYKLQHTIYGITSTDKSHKSTQFGLVFSYKFINSPQQISKIINQVRYLIYSCKLSSYKKNTLLHLISYSNDDILEILIDKKYNYRNITDKQVKIMCKRLNIQYKHTDKKETNIKRIFNAIHSNTKGSLI